VAEEDDEVAVENPPIKDPEPISSGPMSINLGAIRNTEANLRWRGAQWSLALNLSAIVAIMYRIITVERVGILEMAVLAFSCAVIAILDVQWYNVLRRNGRLLDYWNAKLAEHERRNSIRGGMKLFTSPDYRKLAGSRDRLQRRLERITVFFTGLWTVRAVVFFTLAASAALKGGTW